MRVRALSFTAAATCVALWASACGGTESDDLSTESSAAIQSMDEICNAWRQTLDERGDFPVEDFDPEDPSPAELRTVGEYFASGQPAADEAIVALRGVTAPGEIEADVDALISALERQIAAARTQATAAKAGDVAGFKATLDGASSALESVKAAADDLGAERCAF